MPHKKPRLKQIFLLFITLFMLSFYGCSSPQHQSQKTTSYHPSDQKPKAEPHSRYGNPSSYVVNGKRYYVLESAKEYDKTGQASWYGSKFHGRLTSNREEYDMYAMTAASPDLPIPTYVHVTNLDNGKSVVVRVNDRGPFKKGRILDLSYAAAKKLGYVDKGIARVRVTAIDATNQQTMYASKQKHLKAVKSGAEDSAKNASETTVIAQNTTRPVYLQVGAYSNHEKALSVSKEVASLTNIESTVKTSQNKSGPIYLVSLGPILVREKTGEVVSVLAENGFEKPLQVGG